MKIVSNLTLAKYLVLPVNQQKLFKIIFQNMIIFFKHCANFVNDFYTKLISCHKQTAECKKAFNCLNGPRTKQIDCRRKMKIIISLTTANISLHLPEVACSPWWGRRGVSQCPGHARTPARPRWVRCVAGRAVPAVDLSAGHGWPDARVTPPTSDPALPAEKHEETIARSNTINRLIHPFFHTNSLSIIHSLPTHPQLKSE